MDWGKVDAPLASALAGAAPDEPLSVFVQIDRSRASVDGDVLDRLGLGRDAAGLATATLSPAQVDALTDEDFVVYVRLSGQLRMLRQPGAARLAPAGQQEAGAGDKDGGAKKVKRKPRPS